MGDISLSSLAASFVFGVIGFWLFKEGKRRTEVRLVIIGITMIGYSYFTGSPLADWGIGLGLCGLAYFYWV